MKKTKIKINIENLRHVHQWECPICLTTSYCEGHEVWDI